MSFHTYLFSALRPRETQALVVKAYTNSGSRLREKQPHHRVGTISGLCDLSDIVAIMSRPAGSTARRSVKTEYIETVCSQLHHARRPSTEHVIGHWQQNLTTSLHRR